MVPKRLEIPSLDFSGKVCDPDLTQNSGPDMQQGHLRSKSS